MTEKYRKKQEKLESEGWKFIIFLSGNGAMATKNTRSVVAPSLNQLIDKLT